jgi:hypothetical protein|tara:strand:+ start:3085 stop:3396 length:312 start_codon:yes stop_codon:yes gene_type:complete
MTFQKVIVIIAIIILVVMLFSITYLFKNMKNSVDYPPIVAECPDYWTITKSNTCENTKKLGHGCTSKNFDTPKYKGHSGKIEKCKWAKNCGVIWDGITDNNTC